MKEVKVLPAFVFVGHRYVQQAGSEKRGDHYTRYHSHFVSARKHLPTTVAFSYEEGTDLGSKEAAVFLEEGLDQQEGDSLGDAVRRVESHTG